MSRTATATPPPAYFPARHATPSMRHCSAPNVTSAHFTNRQTPRTQHHNTGKRRTKGLPNSFGGLKASATGISKSKHDSTASLGDSFEEIDTACLDQSVVAAKPSLGRTISDISLVSSSYSFVHSDVVEPESESLDNEEEDSENRPITPTPSMSSTITTTSFRSTPIATPASSRASSLLQPDEATCSRLSLSLDSTGQSVGGVSRGSWTLPNFGKMVKAVGISFGDKKGKTKEVETPCSQLPVVEVPVAQKEETLPEGDLYIPTGYTAKPTIEELSRLSAEEALERKREWALVEGRKITECARLCSQWPQSGYNLTKWGPNGSRNYYEPQSYANPEYVTKVMSKQAEMEHQYAVRGGNFFPALAYQTPRSRTPSSDGSDSWTSRSGRSSPATSIQLSMDERREAEIKAAMGSPLIEPCEGVDDVDAELDVMAGAMVLCKDESAMEVDVDLPPTLPVSKVPTRPARAQSCHGKRPLLTQGSSDEEDKRRKVDEAMVMDEAVQTGVIVPPARQLAASTPSLPFNPEPNGAMFGHIVKTSDTHPIIISTMFPPELLPVLSANLVVPGPNSNSKILQSTLDIPSLLLSYVPNPVGPGKSIQVPSPILGSLRTQQETKPKPSVRLGNLFLSSCPGKRLRMDGPCKGRGPVCRDLVTDLKRIKGEGVGCLVW